jgi:small subunit ribosomal protein S6
LKATGPPGRAIRGDGNGKWNMSAKARTYEGMFLLEGGNPDFETVSEPIRKILARSEAEILSIRPWDERRLAYEIRGHKRGLYILTYFKADPSRITEIEHDCKLNEKILRAIILHRERLTDAEIREETPATKAAQRSTEPRREKKEDIREPEKPKGSMEKSKTETSEAGPDAGSDEQREPPPEQTSEPPSQ